MNYQLLYYFHKLAEHLNFTTAANKLGIKQPTLSQQIKILENQLGVQLFSRTNRKVTLTLTGEYLFKQTTSIQMILSDTFDTIKDVEVDENTLRIGVLHGELSELLSEIFVKFHQEEPSINIKFLSTDNLQDDLNKSKIDMGFTYNGVAAGHPCEFLAQEKFYLISPEKYHLSSHIELDSMNQYPIILMTKEYMCRQLVEEEMGKLNKRITPSIEVSSLDILYNMVRNGLGLSIVSETFLNLKDLTDIRVSSIKDLQIDRDIYMYHTPSFANNSVAQRFYNMTLEELTKLKIVSPR